MTILYYHICNPTTPEKKGFKNIISKIELLNIKEDADSVFLINVHLNWDGNKLSNNFGFEIANILRTYKKSKAPIIFYSPIQREYFEEISRKEIKYKILFGRGSGFMEFPIKESELDSKAEKIHPLSNASHHDVVTMLCDLKGIVIDKLNHDLTFESDIDRVISTVIPYLSDVQKQAIRLDEYLSKLRGKIKTSDRNGFETEKGLFIKLCFYELTEEGKTKPMIIKTKYKVLIVDDIQSEIKRIKEFIGNKFSVFEATTCERAIDILTKDVKNEIVAVIADWRLIIDENQNYWQSLQGYEVLEFAAKNGIRNLFALTAQADFLVHTLRNLMGIRFQMFKKENLRTQEQWNVFLDILYETCEDTIKSRASNLDIFPIWTLGWMKKKISQLTLKEQYIYFWNSIGRDSELNHIEIKVEEMLTYQRENNATYLVGSPYFKDYGISVKNLVLKKVLVLRRLWFYYWFSIDKSYTTNPKQEIVSDILFGAGDIAQRTRLLCLHLDKINKDYMLPEEIDWLHRKGLME